MSVSRDAPRSSPTTYWTTRASCGTTNGDQDSIANR
jgi:hypothetical protein